MIFNNDKQQTQDIKRFLKPHSPANTGRQPTDKERKGNAGSPNNRILPIRGQ